MKLLFVQNGHNNIDLRKSIALKVVGSSGGILAGTLTIAGGVMTVMTAGLAAPVLVAGAGLGLASGKIVLFKL